MIDSAVFINVGCGRQINEDDLIMVMKERLDLVEAEPRQIFCGKKVPEIGRKGVHVGIHELGSLLPKKGGLCLRLRTPETHFSAQRLHQKVSGNVCVVSAVRQNPFFQWLGKRVLRLSCLLTCYSHDF